MVHPRGKGVHPGVDRLGLEKQPHPSRQTTSPLFWVLAIRPEKQIAILFRWGGPDQELELDRRGATLKVGMSSS
jgi:hypothetical protein